MLVKIRKPSDICPSEITSQSVYLKRREFLRAGVSAFAGLGLAHTGIADASILKGPGKLEKIPDIREPPTGRKSRSRNMNTSPPTTTSTSSVPASPILTATPVR